MNLDVLRRAQAGDCAALELVLAHYDRGPALSIPKMVSGIVRDLFDVEDIRQQIRVRIFQKLPSFVPRTDDLDRDFHAWVSAIARNLIIDLAKRADRFYTNVENAVLDDAQAAGVTPSRLTAQADAVATIHRCLLQLPSPEREIVRHRFLDGLSDSEIAAKLELSEDAVRGRWQRALPRMRACLGSSSDYYFGG